MPRRAADASRRCGPRSGGVDGVTIEGTLTTEKNQTRCRAVVVQNERAHLIGERVVIADLNSMSQGVVGSDVSSRPSADR